MPWTTQCDHEAVPHLIPWATGRFYGNPFATSTQNTVFGGTNLQATPIYVPNVEGVTVTSIGVQITTGQAGSQARFAIYTMNAQSYPDRLVLDSGLVATTGSGFASASVSKFLAQGWYFLASSYTTTGSFPTTKRVNAVTRNVFGMADALQTDVWFGYLAIGVNAEQQAVATNGFPSYWPLWNLQAANSSGVVDRLMVGI